MSESTYEAKQSKKILTMTCVAVGIFECLLIGLTVLFLIELCGEKNLTFDEVVLYIVSIVFCILFAAIIVVILIYLLHTYKHQIDIYTENKLIRKKGDKTIFELPYENIISIRQGYDSIFMLLNKPIVKANGKKGSRNFYEHYSQKDIHCIKQMIFNKYYNIPCQ